MLKVTLGKRLSVCLVLILSLSAFSQINGSVDWVNRVVKAKGIGAGPEGPSQTAYGNPRGQAGCASGCS